MASTETFESTLKEVVRAKRLSASKVKELTEIAMKTMKSDTQLVSILYRTHKSLSPASKIHSLYTFDALARAARSYANKHNLTGDLNTEPGNCATFLLKVEGVLDGLFKDMLTTDHPDAKEKTKKVLDIWVKGHTFPSDVLSRLQKLVAEAEKEHPKVRSPPSATSADPRLHAAAPAPSVPLQANTAAAASPTPPPSANPVQSQLLAMLSQVVAAAGTGQTGPNTTAGPAAAAPAAVPQLDSKQLALFQQLSQVASAGNVPAPHAVPVPSLVPSAAPANAVPVAPPYGGPSPSHPYRDESNGFAAPRETQYDKYPNGPQQQQQQQQQQQRNRDHYDQRRDPRGDARGPPRDGHRNEPRGDHRSDSHRGDFRGGPRGFRGRGRGRGGDRDQHLSRRWDAPQGRQPHSRSRSPVARNGNRPYSPPRDRTRSPLRPPHAAPTDAGAPGKDEFGRDIRPPSPDAPAPAPAAPEPSPIPTLSTDPAPSTHATESAPLPTGAPIPTLDSATPSAGGIDTFDWTTFDMTAPSSWDALGRAWNVTNGYAPSQEQLWQYVQMCSAGMNGAAYSMGGQYDMQQGAQWGMQEQGWGHGEGWRGRGRGRGRGGRGDGYGQGYGYGNGRGRGRGFDQNTDALTLAGGDDTPSAMQQGYQGWQEEGTYYAQQPPEDDGGNAGGGKGGRMQKVGDRWVFVKT